MNPAPAQPLIDLHVHLVGSGRGGSGCRYPSDGRYRWMIPLLTRWFGLHVRASHRRFDEIYATRVRRHVESSALDAAVILALDAPRDERGRELPHVDSFSVPNDWVLTWSARSRSLLPGVSIHPARPDARDELERCIEGGAALVKLIPSCQNIDLGAKRYCAFWDRMAAARLPLLVHTGGERALQELKPEWGHPRVLLGPLTRGVTVIAAHCGGVYQDAFVELAGAHPNLFGDTSAFCAPFSRRRLGPLLTSPVVEKLVHGSDVPAPVSTWSTWVRGDLPLHRALRFARIKNPLQRDLCIKRELGIPESVFRRSSQLLPATAVEKLSRGATRLPALESGRRRTQRSRSVNARRQS